MFEKQNHDSDTTSVIDAKSDPENRTRGPNRNLRIRRFVIGFMSTCLIGIGLTPFLPQYYESVSTIIFHTSDPEGKFTLLRQDLDEKAIQSEIDLLTSLPMTADVIRRLKLQTDPEFNPPKSSLSVDDRTNTALQPDDLGPARYALSHLSVQHDRRSYTVKFGYQTKDPIKSAQMSQMLSKLYLENLTARKQKILSRNTDIARSKLLSESFRYTQIASAMSELNGLNNETDTKQALADLVSERVKISAMIDETRAEIAKAAAYEQNAEPDADLISPAEPQSHPTYPNQTLIYAAIAILSCLMGFFTALKNNNSLIPFAGE